MAILTVDLKAGKWDVLLVEPSVAGMGFHLVAVMDVLKVAKKGTV